jgi:hypothetical protein
MLYEVLIGDSSSDSIMLPEFQLYHYLENFVASMIGRFSDKAF